MKGNEEFIIAMGIVGLILFGMIIGSFLTPECVTKSNSCDLIENETMNCVNVMNEYCNCEIVKCVEKDGYEFCTSIEKDIRYDIEKLKSE